MTDKIPARHFIIRALEIAHRRYAVLGKRYGKVGRVTEYGLNADELENHAAIFDALANEILAGRVKIVVADSPG